MYESRPERLLSYIKIFFRIQKTLSGLMGNSVVLFVLPKGKSNGSVKLK